MEYSEACSNVWYILRNLEFDELSKIPRKLLETIYMLKIDDYEVKIDLNKPLEEQELSDATIGLISYIYNNYLGTPEEKQAYVDSIKSIKNYNNYEVKFDKPSVESKEENLEMAMTLYSEDTNIFLKLINKIKKIFLHK